MSASEHQAGVAPAKRRRPRRALVVAAVAVGAASLGGGLVAAAGGQPSEAPAPDSTVVDTADQYVADADGRVRGTMDGEDFALMRPTSLRAGDGAVAAYEVRDETDELVGYMVSGLGYVDLDVARDGELLGALVAEKRQEDAPIAAEIEEEILRRERARIDGDG